MAANLSELKELCEEDKSPPQWCVSFVLLLLKVVLLNSTKAQNQKTLPGCLWGAVLSFYRRLRQSPEPSTQHGPADLPPSSSLWWQPGTCLPEKGESRAKMHWIIQLPIFHSRIMYLHTVCMLILPATKRIVPISPHIGLVSADAGTSCLTEKGDRDTTMVFMDTGNISVTSSKLGL